MPETALDKSKLWFVRIVSKHYNGHGYVRATSESKAISYVKTEFLKYSSNHWAEFHAFPIDDSEGKIFGNFPWDDEETY